MKKKTDFQITPTQNGENKAKEKHNHRCKEKQNYRAFPLKKTLAITLLSIGALLLSVAGIAISAYHLAKYGVNSFYECLQYPFLIAVCLFAIVVVTAVLIKCEYRVTNTELITCHGFVKTTLPLSEITAAVSDTDNDKIYLSLTDTEGKLILSTTHEQRENLVRAMIDGNPSIDYGFTLRKNQDNSK